MKRFLTQCLLYLGILLPPVAAKAPGTQQIKDTVAPVDMVMLPFQNAVQDTTKKTVVPVKAADEPLPKVDQKAFKIWLKDFKAKAIASKLVPENLLHEALPDTMTADPVVVSRDRNQPGAKKKDIDAYLTKVVSESRITNGRARLNENRALLDTVCKVYGATPEMIVALWGLETSYGKVTGDFNIARSLATLGYAGRNEDRRAYFTGELKHALKLMHEEKIRPADFKGSWAGAFGQSQSMPGSFYTYAVDFDKDGKKDIMHNLSDIFGFAANHMKKVDWTHGETWGYRVELPKTIDTSLIDRDHRKPLEYWEKLGVRLPGGAMIPRDGASPTAALIQPDGKGVGKPAYLVFDNFRALRRWNKSDYFAVSAGLLYDKLKTSTPAPTLAPGK